MSPPQLAVLSAGLALAFAGWIMISRGRPRFSKPGYLLLVVGLLAFLAGPDLVASVSNLGPTTRARLMVVTPVDGQIIGSSEVPISVRVFQPAAAGWTPITASELAGGRIRITIDGRVVGTAGTPPATVRVSTGPHIIGVEYLSSGNRPFSPRVLVTRRITAGPAREERAAPGPAAAPGVGPSPITWRDWSGDPGIVAGLALTVLVYLWTRRRFPPRRWQPVFFWSGMLALVAALLSPIDAWSEYLFSIHMVQHMLLLLVAPPLLALSVPPALLGRFYQIPWMAPLLRAVWSPLPSLIALNGVLVFWHLPFAYDATLAYRWVHALEHVSFVGAGMVFWGVIVSPVPRLVQASFGLRLGLVVIADVVNFLVGFALAFAGRPFYRHYTEVPRMWGLAPLDDLRLGGAIMWTMGQMMYAIPVLILLSVLLRPEDGRGSRRGVAAGTAR